MKLYALANNVKYVNLIYQILTVLLKAQNEQAPITKCEISAFHISACLESNEPEYKQRFIILPHLHSTI